MCKKRAQELFPSSWAHNVISAKWNADGIQNLQTAHPGKAWGKRGAMKTYRIHQKRRIQSRILSAHATFQNAFLITGPAAGNRLEQGTNIQLGHAVFRTFWDRQRGRLLKKCKSAVSVPPGTPLSYSKVIAASRNVNSRNFFPAPRCPKPEVPPAMWRSAGPGFHKAVRKLLQPGRSPTVHKRSLYLQEAAGR